MEMVRLAMGDLLVYADCVSWRRRDDRNRDLTSSWPRRIQVIRTRLCDLVYWSPPLSSATRQVITTTTTNVFLCLRSHKLYEAYISYQYSILVHPQQPISRNTCFLKEIDFIAGDKTQEPFGLKHDRDGNESFSSIIISNAYRIRIILIATSK